MFAGAACRLKALPGGDQVMGVGRIDLYERDGSTILRRYADAPGGGNLMAAFEELKQKLSAEGLFDPEKSAPCRPIRKWWGSLLSFCWSSGPGYYQRSRRRDRGVKSGFTR